MRIESKEFLNKKKYKTSQVKSTKKSIQNKAFRCLPIDIRGRNANQSKVEDAVPHGLPVLADEVLGVASKHLRYDDAQHRPESENTEEKQNKTNHCKRRKNKSILANLTPRKALRMKKLRVSRDFHDGKATRRILLRRWRKRESTATFFLPSYE
jgi:hypothetical protein